MGYCRLPPLRPPRTVAFPLYWSRRPSGKWATSRGKISSSNTASPDTHLDRLPGMARQLVASRVDIILAIGNDAPAAARDASKTVPIVMLGRDPVRFGYGASLARPGGNITGVVISESGLADKRLELLRAVVSKATRVAVFASSDVGIKDQIQEADNAASALGITLLVIDVSDRDYERAFARMASERASALFVPSSPILNWDRESSRWPRDAI